MDLFELISGLVILLFGGEFIVKGAVLTANKFRIPPMVIGLTIVSFGTSAPELLVSIKAATDGNPDIAVGNVIGSNIANLALVLGITVLFIPMIIERSKIMINWSVMMLATIIFYLFSINGWIENWEGIALFSALIVFIYFLIKTSKNTLSDNLECDLKKESNSNPLLIIIYMTLGALGLYFGAELLVEGAVSIAYKMGMSEAVIGVTVVALGTSAPELTASIVAAYRKESGISLGNLIGSNIFNLMAVIGITGMVKPISIAPKIMAFDIYWLLGVSLLIFPVVFFSSRIGRVKGFLLLSFYVVYITLVLNH